MFEVILISVIPLPLKLVPDPLVDLDISSFWPFDMLNNQLTSAPGEVSDWPIQ